jgi:hypothetical protein
MKLKRHIDFINENVSSFFESLSAEDLKKIGSYLEVWLESDTADTFDTSNMDWIFDLVKGSKYTKNDGEIHRLLFLDIEKAIKEDGSLDKDKLHQMVNVGDRYYSYTKSLADAMYIFWFWTDMPKLMRGYNYGTIIKQSANDSFNVTDFITDAYQYVLSNHSSDEELSSLYFDLHRLEDSETEIIAKKDPNFEIVGIVDFDPENERSHKKSVKVKGGYDDFEKEADLYFYPTEKFKLKK